MEKTIKLRGRIDSSNAAEVENSIVDELKGFDGNLFIDADELEYISSAGLRVILRLKKTYKTAKVINCNPEIYEIFDMTGFTEMMDISKAFRKLSIEGCEVIGEGANGIVYRTDPDTIVKVYKNHDALNEISKERELARKAFVMGIPTAIPYDVVKVGEYYGSVFELLNAKSFAKLIIENIDSVENIAKESVEILKTIHSTFLKEGELPNKKTESLKWAEFVRPYLPEDIGDKLLKLFNGIPDTLNMIHGDYHIKNIMRQGNENLLIDMDTLSMGHPVYEFAGIFAAYVGYSCVDRDNPAKFFNISREQADALWKLTLKYYFPDKDEKYLNEIEAKASIISYARIMRQFIRKNEQNENTVKHIEFCKNYLIEKVPVTDSLSF
ncbi:MAG: phosphotransferase [Clostridia bacterium]|nr:phosphotransferase [Clostridia bacterium]